MRNAFLNAPWVKAVIPIRPGQERAAMNWLQSDTRGRHPTASTTPTWRQWASWRRFRTPDRQATVLDAINYLCDKVAAKHKDATKVGQYPPEEINGAATTATSSGRRLYSHIYLLRLTGGLGVGHVCDVLGASANVGLVYPEPTLTVTAVPNSTRPIRNSRASRRT